MLNSVITRTKRYTGKLLEVTDMFITSIVVIASWVYAYVQIHQIVCIKHVWFGVCQLFLNIVVKKKKKGKPSHPLMN